MQLILLLKITGNSIKLALDNSMGIVLMRILETCPVQVCLCLKVNLTVIMVVNLFPYQCFLPFSFIVTLYLLQDFSLLEIVRFRKLCEPLVDL